MTRSGFLFGNVGPLGPGGGGRSPIYQKADTVNHEGFPAFTRSIEETTLSFLMTNMLSNTFYVSQEENVKETVDVLTRMADKDPVFLAKALVYARNRGLLKLAPTVGLTVLSASEKEGAKKAFRLAFRHVVQIPDDLREFVELCKKAQIRKGKRVKVVTKVKDGKRVVVDRQVMPGQGGLGGLAKLCVQNWLRHMSEFHAVKYGSDASKGITLPDIVKLAHPSPSTRKADKGRDYDRLRNGAQRELFGWLVKGWNEIGPEPSPTNPMVWALERIKRLTDEEKIVSLVEKYKLPHEVVVPSVKKMTTAIWQAILKGMPYMAMLRSLNTMVRNGAFDDAGIVKDVAKRLSDKENVLSSKQLPFRFLSASKAFKGPQEIRDALTDAMEHSFANLPDMKGLRFVISNDVSTSMDMKVVGAKKVELRPGQEDRRPECREIAGIFAAALFKRCEDSAIVPFNTAPQPDLGRVSKRDSIMTISRQISQCSGGTNLAAPVEYMMDKPEKVDVFIVLTDDEDWAGKGFLTAFEQYKARRNPAVKAFCIRLAPKSSFSAPPGYENVYFIEGWSASVLSFIPLILNGGTSQVDEVRKIDLDSFGKKDEAVLAASAEEDD